MKRGISTGHGCKCQIVTCAPALIVKPTMQLVLVIFAKTRHVAYAGRNAAEASKVAPITANRRYRDGSAYDIDCDIAYKDWMSNL